jgi:hypothetical protein
MYWPAGQIWHEVAPKMLDSEPAWQSVHEVDPVLALKKPGPHIAGGTPPPGHAQPAGQVTLVLVEPTGQKKEARQLMHVALDVAPVAAE